MTRSITSWCTERTGSLRCTCLRCRCNTLHRRHSRFWRRPRSRPCDGRSRPCIRRTCNFHKCIFRRHSNCNLRRTIRNRTRLTSPRRAMPHWSNTSRTHTFWHDRQSSRSSPLRPATCFATCTPCTCSRHNCKHPTCNNCNSFDTNRTGKTTPSSRRTDRCCSTWRSSSPWC